MRGELERVYEGEVVAEGEAPPTREELIGMWATSSQNILLEEFRRAKILATAHRLWGRNGLIDFARDVGFERSEAYKRCRLWRTFGYLERAEPDLSTRLDNSPLDVSHWIAASYAPDPMQAIEEAEDEKLSVRAIEARNREKREQSQIEEAEERGQTAETVGEEVLDKVLDGGPDTARVDLKKNAFICRFCGEVNELGEE